MVTTPTGATEPLSGTAASRIQVCIDCHDDALLWEFWARALDDAKTDHDGAGRRQRDFWLMGDPERNEFCRCRELTAE